jgi:hypothetical protein
LGFSAFGCHGHLSGVLLTGRKHTPKLCMK